MVAVVVVAGTASGVEVTPHAGEKGRAEGPSLPVAPTAPAVRVESVEVVARPAPAVRVRLSKPAELRTRTLRRDGGAPARIYIDVPGSALGAGVVRSIAGKDPIVRVRSGQFDPSTARIIIELARDTPFEVAGVGATATITVGPTRVAGGAPKRKKDPPKPAAKPRPESPPPVKAEGPGAVAAAVGPPAPEPAAEAPASVAAVPAEPPPENAPALPVRVTKMGAALFAWPALDAPEYADAAAEPFRRALAAWEEGSPPAAPSPGLPGSPAARYLAADLTFLEAAEGRANHLAAAEAYEHALREAPDFPDAARGQFMLGQSHLALGFGPEAGGAFGTLEQRFPESPLVPYALVGQATSLRLRHRVAEARTLLDRAVARASGEVLCRARLEQAALAGTPAGKVDAYRRLADGCPHALEDPATLTAYAESLVAAGDRNAAWRLLTAPREPGSGDDEGRLRLLAASIAPDPASARVEYERVLGMKVSPAVGLETEMRLVMLDAADTPDKTASALVALAAKPGPAALRALILGEAAEAMARAGRFEEALGAVDGAAALGGEGAAQADGRRKAVFGRWISALAERGDDAGVATLYAAYTTALREIAAPNDRLVVARALGRIGLHAPAMKLLELTAAQTSDPEASITLAEEALAAGDPAAARAMPARLKKARLAPPLAARLHAAAARAALASDDLDAATAEASATEDLDLRAEVARALLARPGGPAAARSLLEPLLAAAAEPPARALVVAGAAALEEEAWAAAAAAYGRALERAAPGAERAEAAAGVVRAARARGDQAAATAALAQVAEAGGLDRKILARLSARNHGR